jgi:ubiquinone/menaquinone biosynthesis C-methylase UbiE
MATEHNDTIIDQFSKQAIPFAKLPGHLDSIQMLIEMSHVNKTDSVLDVACGPGLVACEFANIADSVTGIDITEKMIEEAKKHQNEKQLKNISWDIGDINSLPYSDNKFSIVLTRYSFHHFLEPKKVLSEMHRVCKPNGTIMVVDVALPSEKIDKYNMMEKLRDPSHTKALTHDEFEKLFNNLNLENRRQATYTVEVELEQQLEASFPNQGDDEKIRLLIEQDIGIDELGIHACKRDEKIYFTYPISIYVGQKA